MRPEKPTWVWLTGISLGLGGLFAVAWAFEIESSSGLAGTVLFVIACFAGVAVVDAVRSHFRSGRD
jgi:hypothetical protein